MRSMAVACWLAGWLGWLAGWLNLCAAWRGVAWRRRGGVAAWRVQSPLNPIWPSGNSISQPACGDRRGLRPERGAVLYAPPTAKPGLAVNRGAGEGEGEVVRMGGSDKGEGCRLSIALALGMLLLRFALCILNMHLSA